MSAPGTPTMVTALDHTAWMRRAIAEAELARGGTGDNPWVGCVVVTERGELLGVGHTQGPGEDHAEIAAFRQADERGSSVAGATLYSTLEPCSFHGRTPACSRVIVDRKIGRVITGMRDPHPRVDGVGVRILQEAGIEVLEGVCEDEVRRQLGRWVLQYHPHEPIRRARALATLHPPAELAALLASIYGVAEGDVAPLLSGALSG
ncbi:MAG TPA: bifunctional diaminohydroxyphosphoribosylaminopyrimidine deaminase/5-amino-6-(5-phosphoribosylamino)uracil reductase RibD [Polyangiaceae bacterium]|nr:bifunctional diaminohydroxyphosphoribosylaminopyrimidine deaminase/5-amino-6-(5-phosphoribosylamino)uracil reductase RibD [Polyangiaceae bacterium]